MSNLPRPHLKQVRHQEGDFPVKLLYLREVIDERVGFTCGFYANMMELLVKVWAIADSKRQGFLGLKEFITAMQV